jgi:aerobic carbon-monoxide dehydrogenase small subunit
VTVDYSTSPTSDSDLGELNQIDVTLNGRPTRLTARSNETLVDVLRNERLYGVREGCGVGMCGACTVLIDGQPQSGCLVLAPLAAGKDIRTVEGLEDEDGNPDEVQRAFLKHTAFQCSYCTPGFIMMTERLLEEIPDATREEAAEYLSGNLCRCGSYVKILDAVMDLLAGRAERLGDG